jgi:hypothetical protein
MQTASFKTAFLFWLHLAAVVATWVLPFLVQWKIAIAVYAAVMIQFAVFGKCLMNEHHGLTETGDRIFYTEVLERMGFQPNERFVKVAVRQFLYPTLALVTLIWQLWLGHAPLLF